MYHEDDERKDNKLLKNPSRLIKLVIKTLLIFKNPLIE
jgi:hypothetical protein